MSVQTSGFLLGWGGLAVWMRGGEGGRDEVRY